MISDELDDWFNEQDEQTIEIINNNLNTHVRGAAGENSDCTEQVKTETYEEDPIVDAATKRICVEDIIKKDPHILSSFEAIQYECSIAYFIQVLMEGSTNKTKKTHNDGLTFDKMQSIVEYLGWISLASGVLAKRINQEVFIYNMDNPMIIRSSYNFCNKYTQCKNFYSKNEAPNCKEHHYVHSLLKNDVDSVISFLKYIIQHNIFLTHDELHNVYLSIKTICFVTRHMAKEISYIHYITKNNSETFHRNNPFELNKKKIVAKKPWNDSDRPPKIMRPENFSSDRKYVNHTRSYDTYPVKISERNGQFPSCRPVSHPNSGGFRKTIVPIVSKKNEMPTTNNRYSILSDNT